jgi:hypothetical protein
MGFKNVPYFTLNISSLPFGNAKCTSLAKLLFALLKMQYRKYLMHFRAETGKASPGLEQGTKKAFELLNSMSTRVTEACWKRTGLKRFATLEVRGVDFDIIKFLRNLRK